MTEQEPEVEETAGEPRQMSERTAKAIVIVIAVGAVWGLVAAFPWIAYVITGVLLTLGWQKARGWIGRRQGSSEEEPQAVEVDVAEALQYLARGGRSVLLTELRDELGVADTKAVRALLAEAGIPVRPGVRTPGGNGPGVHQVDVPPLSPVGGASVGVGVVAGGGANANTNNAPSAAPGEGLRVEPIGQAGAVVHDPADAVRHHRVQ